MNLSLRKEILNLIESPELHQYLFEHPEKLNFKSYAEIIFGAPISIENKRTLTFRLNEEAKNDKDRQSIENIRTILADAEFSLINIYKSQLVYAVSLIGYDENKIETCIDGPYYSSSWSDAQKAIRMYRSKYLNEDDWKSRYWRIEQYSLNEEKNEFGFCRKEPYVYFADISGNAQYFECNYNYLPMSGREYWNKISENVFHELKLPVPFKPGDILRIDCRPYSPEPAYCLVTEIGNDYISIQCLYPGKDGKIEQGDLKQGQYLTNSYNPVHNISPLYRARVYNGELPKNCDFMIQLSKNL